MCSEEETIPINVSNTNTNILCDFSVNINEKDRLIIKNTGQTLNAKDTIDLNITYNGILSNPNLRIKIYKKLNRNNLYFFGTMIFLAFSCQYLSLNWTRTDT